MTLESYPAFLTYLRLIPANTCALRHGATAGASNAAIPLSTHPRHLNSAAPSRGRAERHRGPALPAARGGTCGPARFGLSRRRPRGVAAGGPRTGGPGAGVRAGPPCGRAEPRPEGPAVTAFATSPSSSSARPRCPLRPSAGRQMHVGSQPAAAPSLAFPTSS